MHAHCTWSRYASVCSFVSDDKQSEVCMLGSQNRPYCPDKDTVAAAAAETASQSKHTRQQLAHFTELNFDPLSLPPG